MQLAWHDRAFAELSTAELYAIVALRERVFVVEQRCAYLDADGRDPQSRHVFATADHGDLIAYLRVVPPDARHPDVSIGRVVIAPAARGAGLGRELMTRGLAAAHAHHGAVPIVVAAQAHLEVFYAALGFVRAGEVYDDDGIPHVDMRRA